MSKFRWYNQPSKHSERIAMAPHEITLDDYRLSDPEIRAALRSLLLAQSADEKTVVIEELGICRGRTRIDMAVVNGGIHGYEIKSDRDSLRRLRKQVEIYNKVVAKATLVIGCAHLEESLALVPDWWGVMQAETTSGQVQFETVRTAGANPRIEIRSLVELLWRDTAISLLDQKGATRGVRSKPRRIVWDRICEQFEKHEIAVAVCDQLRFRVMSEGLQPPS